MSDQAVLSTMKVLYVTCPDYQSEETEETSVGEFVTTTSQALPPSTSTPLPSQRSRHPPQRLYDSAIGSELERSVSAWESDEDLSDTDDTNWTGERLACTSEEESSIVQPAPSSATAGPSGTVLGAVAAVGAPIVPSTSRGTVGSGPGVSPIAVPLTSAGVSATPSLLRCKRKLEYSSSSSSGEDLPVEGRGRSKSRSRRKGGRPRVRGGRRGRSVTASRHPRPDSDDPDDPQAHDLTRSCSPSSPQPSPSSPQPCRRQQLQHQGNFVWSAGSDFRPNVPTFDATHAGIQPEFPCTAASKMKDYFTAFFDVAVVSLIVRETNANWEFLSNWGNISQRDQSHMKCWHAVTIAEMYIWFALTMLMAHMKKHRLIDYWSTEDLISTPVFGDMMSRDRYRDILKYLQFSTKVGPHPNDRLWKLRPVTSLVLQNIRAFMKPYQKVVIDESLVLFRGRLSFRQYIPSKRHRFGIKYYVLCDCQTGYVLDFIIYTGSDVEFASNDPHGFSGAVVKHLMHPFYGKNHILYTDNYYTSPLLSQFLKEHGTESCGTVRTHRREYPDFPGTQRGDCATLKSGDMLAIRWHDKRAVHMLTTVHKGEMIPTGKVEYGTGNPILKPDVVLDYNVNMRLIDKSDMMISTIDCLRKSVKWYRKAFLHLIDICVLNAYILYCQQHRDTSISLREFEKGVISQLLEEYRTAAPRLGKVAVHKHQLGRLSAVDSFAQHYLQQLETTIWQATGPSLSRLSEHNTPPKEEKRDKILLCKVQCWTLSRWLLF